MTFYRLNKLINWVKNSNFAQGALLTFLLLPSILYSYFLMMDFINFRAILEYNEKCIISDSSLEKVTDYTINTDGSAVINLVNGGQQTVEKPNIAFIKRTSDDRCYYSSESSNLLCEISSMYGVRFLLDNNFLIMFISNILWFIILYKIRDKEFTLLSRDGMLYLVIFSFLVLTISGFCTCFGF